MRGWIRRHGEWLFVAVALVVALSTAIGTDPQADSGAYIAATFGTELFVVGCYTAWMVRSDRRTEGNLWIAFAGVPVAVYLAALPDLLAGHMNDDRTGTVASLFLFALIVAACVPLGLLAGFLVILPLGMVVVGAAMALTGRLEGLGLVLLAGFPLSVVAAGLAGAIAMDNVPDLSDTWGSQAAGGLAMLFRGFGVHNGIVIVNETALVWFRVLALVNLLYIVAAVAGRSGSRGAATAPSSPAAA